MTDWTPMALSVGTSDSSGETGVQRDLAAFTALGVRGACVVTAVAARSSRELAAVAEVPEEVVIAQIDATLADIDVDAVHIGALWSRAIAENVVDRLEAWGIAQVVVSPSLSQIGQAGRLDGAFMAAWRREVLPFATVLSLDAREAEFLIGSPVQSLTTAKAALAELQPLCGGVVHVIGVLNGEVPFDLVFDGDAFTEMEVRYHQDVPDAGFGGTLTALLARGVAPLPAIREARRRCPAADPPPPSKAAKRPHVDGRGRTTSGAVEHG